MTRSIEALTPLERKQMLERMSWEREGQFRNFPPFTMLTQKEIDGDSFSKLSPSESDELDNCVL